jgi:deoxycytidylate deaminase
MYCTHFPCPDCARGIIQSGITSLYYPEDRSEEGKKFRLKEAGVQCIIFQQSSSPSGQTTIFSTHEVKPEDLMP